MKSCYLVTDESVVEGRVGGGGAAIPQDCMRVAILMMFRFVCKTLELFSAACDCSSHSLSVIVDLLEAVLTNFFPLLNLYVKPTCKSDKEKSRLNSNYRCHLLK